jgi:hypothetical protein
MLCHCFLLVIMFQVAVSASSENANVGAIVTLDLPDDPPDNTVSGTENKKDHFNCWSLFFT